MNPVFAATFWMVGTIASFLLMAIAGKELSAAVSTFEILFWRSAVGVVIVLLLLWRADWVGLRTARIGAHGARNLIHFAAQSGWFFALAYIPIAEVFAIEFSTPVWTVVLAALFLGEAVTRTRFFAVAVGFLGIVIILRPGFESIGGAQLSALGAAFGYALAYVFTKHLVASERPITILFYMTLLQLPLGLALSLPNWVWPQGTDWIWVAIAGSAGLTAHYCLSRALQLADATIVTPLDFMRLPAAAVVGFVIYQQTISVWVFAGAALIFVGLFVNVRAESVRARAD